MIFTHTHNLVLVESSLTSWGSASVELSMSKKCNLSSLHTSKDYPFDKRLISNLFSFFVFFAKVVISFVRLVYLLAPVQLLAIFSVFDYTLDALGRNPVDITLILDEPLKFKCLYVCIHLFYYFFSFA